MRLSVARSTTRAATTAETAAAATAIATIWNFREWIEPAPVV
jgi:hypothetical protein